MVFVHRVWTRTLANRVSVVICIIVRICSQRPQRISSGEKSSLWNSKKQRFYNVQVRKHLLAGSSGFHVVSMLTTWNPELPAQRGIPDPDFNGCGTSASRRAMRCKERRYARSSGQHPNNARLCSPLQKTRATHMAPGSGPKEAVEGRSGGVLFSCETTEPCAVRLERHSGLANCGRKTP